MSLTDSLQKYRASGKLMLTGEYLVLDGAMAWAVPTRFGQTLTAIPSPGPGLKWQSFDSNDKVWFEALWDGNGRLLSYTDLEVADSLNLLLQSAINNNSSPFSGWEVKMEMDFPQMWGLGSSSSLVACLAHWLKLDPFVLFESSMTGSGYDVAVAYENKPVLYFLEGKNQRKVNIDLHKPKFTEHIYFAYSGYKQSSSKEVARYQEISADRRTSAVKELNLISSKMCSTRLLNEFQDAMKAHEEIIGTILGRKGLNEKYDLKGTVKHLGAWGGDFFMVATQHEDDLHQLREAGIKEIFTWDQMIADY